MPPSLGLYIVYIKVLGDNQFAYTAPGNMNSQQFLNLAPGK